MLIYNSAALLIAGYEGLALCAIIIFFKFKFLQLIKGSNCSESALTTQILEACFHRSITFLPTVTHKQAAWVQQRKSVGKANSNL